MIDKLPPQHTEAEEMLIGSCLVDNSTAIECVTMLSPDMFYKESHKHIWRAIKTNLQKSGHCDMVVVSDWLKKENLLDAIGGVMALANMSSKITTTHSALNMGALIREKWMLREFIRISHTLSDKSYMGDLDDVVGFAEKEIFELLSENHSNEPVHIRQPMEELILKIGMLHSKEIEVIGVRSGFTTIDRITSGWQKGDLIIIGARPSMGKTAMALALAKGSAILGQGVAIFSLEMSNEQLAGRYLSGQSGYSNTELKSGDVKDMDKLKSSSSEIECLPIYVDDSSALTVFELKSKLKKLIVRNGVKLAIVDYLQLMKSEAGNREQEISSISRGLKAIAKELEIPIIALSQLNRGVEERSDKRPKLSDLRESGAIEQDADMVAFLYRPAYYQEQWVSINGANIPAEGVILFDISKHRNGALSTLALYHNQSMTEIAEDNEFFNAPF